MFTSGLIVGIFIGLLITSRHFRVIVTKWLRSFISWCKEVLERNKKIRKLEHEVKKLHEITDTISYTKRIG
jgi:hypothetical protein